MFAQRKPLKTQIRFKIQYNAHALYMYIKKHPAITAGCFADVKHHPFKIIMKNNRCKGTAFFWNRKEK